jgi:hypothetical protein
MTMGKLPPDKVRSLKSAGREGRGLRGASSTVRGEIDSQPGGSLRSAMEAYRRSREVQRKVDADLAGLVRSLAGPGPCAAVIGGMLLAMNDEEDSVVAVPLDRVAKFDPL